MAQPFDALAFREIFGRSIRNRDTGFNLAFWVTPLGKGEGDGKLTDREMFERVDAVRHHLHDILDLGEIFYVNSEISHQLWEEALKFPDDKLMHWEPGDFPTRVGYVYFDADLPLPTSLSRDGTQPLRALMWGQLQRSREIDHAHWLVPGSDSGGNSDVVGKVLYSVVDNPRLWRNRRVERAMGERIAAGRWATRHWVPLEYQTRYDPNMVGQMMEKTEVPYLDPEEQEEDQRMSQEAVKRVFKLLYIWSQFMQTEIVGHDRYDSRDHDKVMAREGRPPANIRIVTLRRYASVPTYNQVEVDWQHRWKVREHYRNQRVGPGRMFIRRTLIHEHWKGPENKPQAHQDTIQALVR